MFRCVLLYVCVNCSICVADRFSINELSDETNAISSQTPKTRFYQNVITGCAAGLVDVVVNHPLWAIKFMQQTTGEVSYHPRALYRGMISNTVTMIPLTTMRVSMSSLFQKEIYKEKHEKSLPAMMTASFFGGVFPALLGGPFELIRALEHHNKTSLRDTYYSFLKTRGISKIFIGTPGIAMRDGIYTCGFSAIAPMIKDFLKTESFQENQENNEQKQNKLGTNDLFLSALSGSIAGVLSSIVSHPFDTLKAKQQYIADQKDITLWDASKTLYKTDGIKGFYKGVSMRGIRVISGTILISYTTEKMNNFWSGSFY